MRAVPLALGVVAALAAVYLVGALVPATPPAIQGDTLGPREGESWVEYEGRAGASLSQSSLAAFALVTFARPLTPAEAAEALAPAARVNGLLLVDAPLHPTPEPPEGESRADVFAREARRVAERAAENGVTLAPDAIDAAVVHDTGDTLRKVAAAPDVLAVEVLPDDAVWGTFGVYSHRELHTETRP